MNVAIEKLRITLCKSLNGRLKSHKACARGLGLRKMWQTIDVVNTDENRGMVNKIDYMLKIQEV
jgi:large subunit ribosomal protein L30